jgi:hypothetical protein
MDSRSEAPPGLRRTTAALGMLFLLDLGYSGQGLVSLLVAVLGLALLAVGALWSRRRGAAALARSRAGRACVYVVLGVCAVGTLRLNMATAETRAGRVIEACRAFELRNGILPDRLEQLVPEFLASVPRAKYTLAWGEFTYSSTAERTRHTLMYVTLPPFGRRIYHFEGARWSALD